MIAKETVVKDGVFFQFISWTFFTVLFICAAVSGAPFRVNPVTAFLDVAE